MARAGKILLGVVAVVIALPLVAAIALMFVDWNAHRDTLARLVERYTDYEVERLERLDIDLYFPTRVRIEDFRITQDLPDSAFRVAEGGSVEVALAPLSLLSGRPRIRDLTSDGLRVELASPPEPAPANAETAPLPLLEHAEVTDAEVVYRMADPEAPPYRLRIERFEVAQAGGDGPVALSGRGELLALPFTVEGELAPIEQLASGAEPGPVRIDATVAGDIFAIEGDALLAGADGSFDGVITAEGSHLAELIRPFREVERLPAYSLRTRLRQGPDGIALTELRARLGESEVSGEASIEMHEPLPHIRADLDIPLLQHHDYAPLVPVEVLVEPEEEPEVLSRDPIDSSGLRRLNADLKLRLGEYRGEGPAEMFRNMQVTAKLRDGELIANPLEADIGSGKVGGALVVRNRDDNTTQLEGKLSASAIDVPALLAPHLDEGDPRDYFNGQLFASARFTTAGSSPYDWTRGLDGGLALAVEQGSISLLAIEALGLHVTGTALAWLRDNPLTELHCLIGVIDIEQGVMDVQQFLISTPTANVVMDGEVDLREEHLDLKLESHSKDLNVIATGSPIGISGKLDDIGIDVLSGELAARVGGAALLAAAAPVLALLPMTQTGEEQLGRCREVESQLRGIEETSRRDTREAVEKNDAAKKGGQAENDARVEKSDAQ